MLGVSKNAGGPFLDPYMRDAVILGPYWVPGIFENFHMGPEYR